MTNTEQRLRRLEDRAAISDLVTGYFLAADGDDLASVANSFTDAATFSSSGTENATGRDGIVEFIRVARGHMGLTVHTPHYVQLVFEGSDAASGMVGAHLELVLGGTALYGAVRYLDRYERTAEGWLIAARDMRTIFIAPWQTVGQAIESATPVRWTGADPATSDYSRS